MTKTESSLGPKNPTRSASAIKRHKAPQGECGYCDQLRADGSNFHPSHDASDSCESGKHNHCTCDMCF